jgi:histidine triad (HIT) family protein
MAKLKTLIISLSCLIAGIIIGGYLFSHTEPRSFLAVNRCQNCVSPNELAGLVASVGVRRLPGLIPFVVLETDKTIVIRNPFAKERVHYLLIPKRDIKNIGEISKEDMPYLIDIHAVARAIIEKEKLYKYRLYTNGPGVQHVAYLHFHLVER